MPHPTRRQVLTTAASLAAGSMLPIPTVVARTSMGLPFAPSALLLEHRRLATPVVVLRAIDPIEHLYGDGAVGLLPENPTSEQIQALVEPFQARHRAAIDAHLPALSAISRAIWATPATTWSDVVARAELVAFWRPLSDEDDHGYEDHLADKKLVEAVISAAVEVDRLCHPGAEVTKLFVPPPLLIEHRRVCAEWSRRYAADVSYEQRIENFIRRFKLEEALLAAATPARTWTDVVVRAEITSRRRRQPCVSIGDDMHAWFKSSILDLAKVPGYPDVMA